ncbi:MAG: replicative DNA helicase [Ilumatobacteraceae bacterium]
MSDTRNSSAPPRGTSARVPPHNLDAEASLLGAMLLSKDAIGAAAERAVTPSDFYKSSHQHIHDAIQSLNVAGEPVDVVTVSDKLQRAGFLETVGGIDYLLELQNSTPAVSSADRYARIVRETSMLRRLILAASEIAELGYSQPDNIEQALDRAESSIFEVAQNQVSDTMVRLNDLMPETMDRLSEIMENGNPITGVPTGFVDLDALLSGLQPGTLNIIGARPAMGKSALAMGMAVNVATTTNKPVLFFSLEMGRAELSQRILSSEARVDSAKLRTGRLNEEDWRRIGRAIGRLSIPLFIDDNSAVTVMEIRAKARRIAAKHGDLAMIVIDYLQLMGGNASAENRQLEVSEISRNLKILARDFKVPVVALSQLSRGIETRTDKRPTLSDLRESGALEQDADVVMFLYRPSVNDDDPQRKADANLQIAKHRAGALDDIRLVFLANYTRFDNFTSKAP